MVILVFYLDECYLNLTIELSFATFAAKLLPLLLGKDKGSSFAAKVAKVK